jgi:acyl-CoA synthetase (AMP-forming)/AMP-acid ligase II
MESDRGHRLLPATLDALAVTVPQRIYAAIPCSSDLEHGFRDVTVAEVSQAVDALAHWLCQHYGRSSSFKTIAYIGLNDLRYPVFWFAAIKCGYKVSPSTIQIRSY